MAAAKNTVGVVGLGIMGGSFAKNLLAASFRVVGFDVDPTARKAAAKAGVEVVNSAAEVAAAAPTVITSLPKPEALQATAEEIVAVKLPPRVVVEASTFTLEDKRQAEA